MPANPTIITALSGMVEKAYADGLTAPYNMTIIEAVLALSAVGYAGRERMAGLAAAMLNTLEAPERQTVIEHFAVPGPVLQRLGDPPVWPTPVTISDDVLSLTPEQEAAYRDQCERAITYHAEAQAMRVVTYGLRKNFSYMRKQAEAEALLALPEPASETATDWPYLNSDVLAGIETDIVSAATTIKATADAWTALNAQVETIARTGVHGVRTGLIGDIAGVVESANAQVTAAVGAALTG